MANSYAIQVKVSDAVLEELPPRSLSQPNPFAFASAIAASSAVDEATTSHRRSSSSFVKNIRQQTNTADSPPEMPATNWASFGIESSNPGGRQATDYSDVASKALTVILNNSDTIGVAIEKIAEQANEKRGAELPRPLHCYSLLRCFADFSPDFSKRPLTNSGTDVPLRTFLDSFPFFLSLQVTPYEVWKDEVEFELEPLARAKMWNSRRSFVQFAMEYAALLSKLSNQYHFLRCREADARSRKLEQKRRHENEVRLRMLFQQEKEQRQALAADEEFSWTVTSQGARFMLTHYLHLTEEFSSWLAASSLSHRVWQRTLTEEQRLSTLTKRMRSLVSCHEHLVAEAQLRGRELYTESRIASNVKESRDRGIDSEVFERFVADADRQRRVEASSSSHLLPTILDDKAISGDRFRCSDADP